ncbi:hypothetical protein [Streptomyces sp. NPDC046909]|uniref:hypothetical protein n=1 Tax=Streptomyces sp. NPDC046909 TaxID=3155617 RepID=UPI0034119DD9
MDEADKVDQDAVFRARTTLLASASSVEQRVEAYRVLAVVNPLVYLPRLTEALISYACAYEIRDLPDVALARDIEAVATARRIDESVPTRTELLVRALSGYLGELYRAGRRAEALAVCEEMAAAGRWGYEHGYEKYPAYGCWALAVALAEEGRHGEAAEIRELMVGWERESGRRISFWKGVGWMAELAAAGRHEAALEAFAELVDTTRAEADAETAPLAALVYVLVHHADMLSAAGRPGEARAARQEALGVLTELEHTGERRNRGTGWHWWVRLLTLSGRPAEPAPTRDASAPAFGEEPGNWSPDVRKAYFDGVRPLEKQVATARQDPSVPLPELIALHRRLTVRTAWCLEHRDRELRPLRPAVDEGVALARRLGEREVLGRALTDRSMFLVAAKQYGEAHEDFREVCELLDR